MFLSFTDDLSNFVDLINSNVLSPIMMIMILATGIFLTIRLRFIQIRKFKNSLDETINPTIKSIFVKKHPGEKKKNGISQFQAFSAAIAGTVGTGNIVGVATAIACGGPGAIFWMWFSAFFGMVTNFCENVLGIYFRQKNEKGEYKGGAMYYITHGLGWKWLAIMFAIFAIFSSVGFNLAQSNSISTTIESSFGVPLWVTGIVVAVIVGLVIVGGIKRIGAVASFIVPIMALFFMILSIIIICMNIQNIPHAFALIFTEAFSIESFGFGIMGYGIMRAMRYGVARGVFSNEAGLGSSVMAHSQSNTKEPVKQGLWGIFEIFLDTFVICTLMALVYLTTGAYDEFKAGNITEGAPMAVYAFQNNLGMFGTISFSIILPLFAFTTILSWSFYGEKSIEYLLGYKAIIPFKICYVLLILLGAILQVKLVWNLSDTFNVLMAVPNLIALIGLSGTIVQLVKNYYDRKSGLNIMPMMNFDVNENRNLCEELNDVEEDMTLNEALKEEEKIIG